MRNSAPLKGMRNNSSVQVIVPAMHDLFITDCPSPNHEPRPAGVPIDMLILHYTGMRSGAAALERLCDVAAKVSSHYLIEEDGRIARLVPEERRAFHAGVSYWRGERDINSRSVGIELVNPGHEFGYRAFPKAQMDALIHLARGIMQRHGISPARVLGHSDVAPTRKSDPGELFDWRGLAHHGVGIWPPGVEDEPLPGPVVIPSDVPCAAAADLQEKLAAYGYEVPRTSAVDAATRIVITAFQRHFRPGRIDGLVDAETLTRLDALLSLSA